MLLRTLNTKSKVSFWIGNRRVVGGDFEDVEEINIPFSSRRILHPSPLISSSPMKHAQRPKNGCHKKMASGGPTNHRTLPVNQTQY